MKIIQTSRLELQGEEGAKLEVYNDNLGEPYREGVRISITNGFDREVSAMLDGFDAHKLSRKLAEFSSEGVINAGSGFEFCPFEKAEHWYDFRHEKWKGMTDAGYHVSGVTLYRKKK